MTSQARHGGGKAAGAELVRVVVAESDRGSDAAPIASGLEGRGISVLARADDIASTMLQASRVKAQVVVITNRFTDSLEVLCSRLQELEPRPRTLLLEGEGDEATLFRAIEAGVDGYATSASGEAVLAEAISALSRGESVIPPAMLGPLLRYLIERRREAASAAEQLVQLTPREREVLALLADGLDQRAIGSALFISPDTARTHIQRVLRKLNVHSRAEAIDLIARNGLVDRLERMVESNGVRHDR